MIRSMRFLKVPVALLAVALTVFVWGQNGPQARAVFNDTDGDGVIDLGEQITGSDPASAASQPEDIGMDLLFGTTSCAEGADNDGDGLTDSADAGCADTDHDFVSDAMETLLGSNPNDLNSFPENAQLDAVLNYFGVGVAITCGDSTDNDRDSLIDGADPGCAQIQNDGDSFSDVTEKLFGSDPANGNSVPEHDMANPGSCSDGTDNDLDGLSDGADPGCQPAPNDHLADATVVSSLPYSDTEKINTATSDRTDPVSSCYPPAPQMTVWYSYTATADGVLAADTAGTSFQSDLSVWTSQGGRLVEVGCTVRFSLAQASSRVVFHATAGQTYYFLIGGVVAAGLPANLQFRLAPGTPPANDDFASAATISALPFSGTADTSDATTEFGEPGCYYSRPVSTVWYHFTPSQDTLVLADASASDFSPLIGVWTATVFGLTPVDCSFDGSGGFLQPRLAFMATAGQTYYLQVGGIIYGPASSMSGHLSLSLEVGIPPANDSFAGATTVSSLPFDDTVDALTATAEFGEPVPSCAYGPAMDETLWYRYDATGDGYLAADTSASERYDLIVAAYRGTTLGGLSEIACAYPYSPANRVGFQVAAGQTYYIQVGATSFRGGKFVSGSSGVPIPPPPPAPGRVVVFHMDTLTIPDCATSTFSITDPTGDAVGFLGGPPDPGALDITSVTGGSDSQHACITMQFAAPFPEPVSDEGSPTIILNFDGDELPGEAMSCFESRGSDLSVYLQVPSNLIVPLYPYFPGPVFPPEGLFGYAVFGEGSLRLILPLAALGGDDSFLVATVANSPDGFDCAPDAGAISSPLPAGPGDTNCDGQTNSTDSLLILQLFAGLIGSLPCQEAGDVNNNGGVGPIDATLILQYSSGMLTAFPGA